MAEERIRVVVEPDVTNFGRELERDLDRVNVDYEVDVDADTDPAEREIKETAARIKQVDADLNVDANTKPAMAAVNKATARIARPITKQILANTAAALKSVASFTARAAQPVVKTLVLVTAGAHKALNVLRAASLRTFTAMGRHARTGIGVAATAVAGLAFLGRDKLLEMERQAGQTEAALKSTGGVANVTAEDVNRLAGEIANLTGIDDDAVKATQNLLLTFTNIRNEAGKGNDIFDQTTDAITDMATRMNDGAIPTVEQLRSVTLQMGKALNDPVLGVTALGRAGVQFTEDQKDTIKALVESGDVLGAQNLILEELQTQFGGAAEAIPPVEKALSRIKQSTELAGAEILRRLLPALEKITGTVERAFESGAVDRFLDALKPVAKGIGAVFNEVKTAIAVATDSGDAMKSFEDTAESIGDALVTLAPVIGGVVFGIIKTIQFIRDTFRVVGEFLGITALKIEQFFTDVKGSISSFVENWQAGFDSIVGAITRFIEDWKAGAQAIIDTVLTFVMDWISGLRIIILWFAKLPRRIEKFMKDVIKKFKEGWNTVLDTVTTIANNVVEFVAAIPGRFVDGLRNLAEILGGIATRAFRRFTRGVMRQGERAMDFVKSIPGRIIDFFADAGKWLFDAGRQIFIGLWNGMKDVWGDISGWLGDRKDAIINLKGPPEADSQLLVDNGARVMQGFWDGMRNRWEPISGWLSGLAPWAKEFISGQEVNERAALAIAGDVPAGNFANIFDPLRGILGNVSAGVASSSNIGPARDKYDVLSQAKLLAQAFGVNVGSWLRSRQANLAAGGSPTSQHLSGFAVDFPLGAGAMQDELNKLAGFASQLIGKVFTQVLWQVRDHFDHVHLGWLHRRHGGRVSEGDPTIVGETGTEAFFPDRPGMIVSHAMLNRLLALGSRVAAIEAMLTGTRTTAGQGAIQDRPTVEQHNDITLVHPVPDPSSIMAALNSRLDMFARTATAGFAI